MATEHCPTCGAAVRIVGSDEGTMHFEPVAADTFRRALAALTRPIGPAESQARYDFNRAMGALSILQEAARGD